MFIQLLFLIFFFFLNYLKFKFNKILIIYHDPILCICQKLTTRNKNKSNSCIFISKQLLEILNPNNFFQKIKRLLIQREANFPWHLAVVPNLLAYMILYMVNPVWLFSTNNTGKIWLGKDFFFKCTYPKKKLTILNAIELKYFIFQTPQLFFKLKKKFLSHLAFPSTRETKLFVQQTYICYLCSK